jgi:hypothetical protein
MAISQWNDAVVQLDADTRNIKLASNTFNNLGVNGEIVFKQQAR